MGKINGCLRCLFIFFNVLFAILGCLLIFGTVKATANTAFNHQLSIAGTPSLGWSWVFSIGVLGISCLGIYAGISEKSIALKIFAGFMVIGMIIMIIFGIIMVVARNKVRDALHDASSEIIHSAMQDDSLKAMLEELQRDSHCCGVSGPKDWGNQIPYSCECTRSGGGLSGFGFGSSDCEPKPAGTAGPSQIYSRPCGEVIMLIINFIFQIAMGIFFGFAVTAFLGLLVSLFMIHQIKRHDSSGGGSIAMKGY